MAAERYVDIRTWPERTDVLVVDPASASALAHFPLDPLCDGALWDPCAPFASRAEAAIEVLDQDQDYLRASFHTGEEVRLIIDLSSRKLMEELLLPFGLDLAKIEFKDLDTTEETLRAMPLGDLFQLLCNWHDVIERRYSAGSSLASEDSWAQRAQPDNCYLYCYLASGDAPASKDEGYELLCQLNDLTVDDFCFGSLLRWVYFSRAEFADLDYRAPKALGRLKD